MRIDAKVFEKECGCGRKHEIFVKGIVIESGAVKILEKEMREGGLSEYKKPVIVCDENTYQAAYPFMADIFEKCKKIILSPIKLHADNHGVAATEKQMEETIDLILAVGSGTVHDISRYIANKKGIPFVSVPTAASVDGFVSTVAAMTWNGMKKTMPAVSPIYVFADTDIFSRAPYRLTASGISDLMGKYTALADWKISHILTKEYICKKICDMEMEAVKAVRECALELKDGGKEAYERLMYALILSGLAMQMVGNSRPASGAEHHMSHLWEMEIINPFIDAYHGEKVSVGLVYVLREYKKILSAIQTNRCKVKEYHGLELDLIKDTFGKMGLYESTLEENTPDPMKKIDFSKVEERLGEIAELLLELPEAEEMGEFLVQLGCKASAKEIGIEESLVEKSLRLSPYVRNRLTFMRFSKVLDYE